MEKINCIYYNKQTKKCDNEKRWKKDFYNDQELFDYCYLRYDKDDNCKHQIKINSMQAMIYQRTGQLNNVEDALL